MVNFNGKNNFPGCMARIEAAGHWVRVVDNELDISSPVIVQSIIDGYTLADAKAERCGQVIEKARETFARATAHIAPAEMAGWPILRAEMLAYMADQNAPCPAMTDEAHDRGCSVADLALRVQANTIKFDALRSAISGTSGRHRDAINTLTTIEAVAAYDITTGWPEV